MGGLYDAMIYANPSSRVVVKYREERDGYYATAFQDIARKSEKNFPQESFFENAESAIFGAMGKGLCLVIEPDVEWKRPEKERKTGRKRLFVLAWRGEILSVMAEDLRRGRVEEFVKIACSDCLEDDDEIVPDEIRWKHVTKGEKYTCPICDKEVIA